MVIDTAIARDADKVSADFDADRGFPVRIAIDYSFSTADEELGFVIRDFRTR